MTARTKRVAPQPALRLVTSEPAPARAPVEGTPDDVAAIEQDAAGQHFGVRSVTYGGNGRSMRIVFGRGSER